MRILFTATILASTSLIAAPVFAADRAPDAKERVAIEKILKASGFTSWEEIELDSDGPIWEVDDARTANKADGKVDLKIDPRTMKIVKRHRDD